jgi:menaquinone-dependent protoporphyrinogen IX oxidase
MKVLIVHETKYGNGLKLAETIEKSIGKDAEVTISHVKDIAPEKVANEAPDMLIVVIAVRMFMLSNTVKRWLRAVKAKLKWQKKIIKSNVVFVTHVLKIDTVNFWGKRALKILRRGNELVDVYPEWISGQVAEAEGPFIDGKLDEIEKKAKIILEWAKQ